MSLDPQARRIISYNEFSGFDTVRKLIAVVYQGVEQCLCLHCWFGDGVGAQWLQLCYARCDRVQRKEMLVQNRVSGTT